MSRSKGAGRAEEAQERRGLRDRLRSLFRNPEGKVRAGWLIGLAALCYGLANLALRAALTAGFAALFRAWGIDVSNAHRAPGWARTIYAWHGSVVTAGCALALIGTALLLRRRFRPEDAARPSPRRGLRLALIGFLAATLSGVLFLLTDSLRADWPLTEPRITLGLFALLAIHLMSILAEELLGRGVIYALLRERWGILWATLASALLFTLATGLGSGLVGILNAALLGALCCRLYDRYGLWAGAGLRWGWSATNLLLLGFGGGESAAYHLYAVSEAGLTGGDAGLSCGLWMTLLLGVALFALSRDALLRVGRARGRGRREPAPKHR